MAGKLFLGKKPARPNAVQMKFGAYFNATVLPKPPTLIGRPTLVRAWGMMGNDQCGDCVWAGAAHETMQLRADAALDPAPFTTKLVIGDYGACTGYNGRPPTDHGTDLQAAAKYRQDTGILDLNKQRHKIDIYTALRPGDEDQLALAVQYLGVAGVGIMLPDNAEQQFNYGEKWDLIPGHPPDPNRGHYVPCIGRNSLGDWLLVTWARLHSCTSAWLRACMDEGLAYISRERLRIDGTTPQGINLTQMTDDYTQLTS